MCWRVLYTCTWVLGPGLVWRVLCGCVVELYRLMLVLRLLMLVLRLLVVVLRLLLLMLRLLEVRSLLRRCWPLSQRLASTQLEAEGPGPAAGLLQHWRRPGGTAALGIVLIR